MSDVTVDRVEPGPGYPSVGWRLAVPSGYAVFVYETDRAYARELIWARWMDGTITYEERRALLDAVGELP